MPIPPAARQGIQVPGFQNSHPGPLPAVVLGVPAPGVGDALKTRQTSLTQVWIGVGEGVVEAVAVGVADGLIVASLIVPGCVACAVPMFTANSKQGSRLHHLALFIVPIP